MKTYQAYQAESRQAETKLRVAEQQRTKLEVANAPPEKLARSKKYKLIEKEVNKVSCYIIREKLQFIGIYVVGYHVDIFGTSSWYDCCSLLVWLDP